MKTTGIFEIYEFRVPVNYGDINKEFVLIPFGDIHWTSPHCDLDLWHKELDWMKKQKNALFLGMGDYFDLLSTSERLAKQMGRYHDSTMRTVDAQNRRYTENFYKEISFMKDRVIGLIEGNHYETYIDGTTTTQHLCHLLGCKYLGVSAFVRIKFESRTSPNRKKLHTNILDIFAHHGVGGGRTVGASINKVAQMTDIAEADIYLLGHDHKKSVAMETRLRLTHGGMGGLRLKQRQLVYGRTGSFLKSYVNGESSYVVDSLMRPSDLGTIKIHITPVRKVTNGQEDRYLTISASI